MKYTPSPIPSNFPPGARAWLSEELRRIARAFEGIESVSLDTKGAEPDKYQDGDIVYADGTSWNPGDGEGVYAREGGAWVKSGGGFDPTADQTITGTWTFDIQGAGGARTNQIIVQGNPSSPASGLAQLVVQNMYSSGNTILFECRKNDSTSDWVFRVDNEGDVSCAGSIGLSTGASFSYTLESQHVAYLNAGKNLGHWMGTATSTHLKRGAVAFGVRPSVSRDLLLTNQDFNDVTIRRDWDGQSTYSAAGAMLYFDKDIIDATAETTKWIELQDAGTLVFEIDENNDARIIGGSIHVRDSADTDGIEVSHDGTDVNWSHTNTTDWNITGLTSIQAGTVDADFDAITATSYGGITEANLVDKSAAETVSGAWSFTGGLNALTESRSVSASTNTASTDRGMIINLTGGTGQTFTLDSDPPTDAVVLFDNSAGAAWTIAASTSLIWASDGSTGNRTLADDGLAVAKHRGGGTWVINGGGLT